MSGRCKACIALGLMRSALRWLHCQKGSLPKPFCPAGSHLKNGQAFVHKIPGFGRLVVCVIRMYLNGAGKCPSLAAIPSLGTHLGATKKTKEEKCFNTRTIPTSSLARFVGWRFGFIPTFSVAIDML